MKRWEIRRKYLGIGGICYCPKCGYEMEHHRSEPCYQIECPKCGEPMDRKEE